MKIKDLSQCDPEAEIVLRAFDGAYGIKKVLIDEGIYDSEDDSYVLLSENNLTDLEARYGQGEDGLAFVSLVVLEA